MNIRAQRLAKIGVVILFAILSFSSAMVSGQDKQRNSESIAILTDNKLNILAALPKKFDREKREPVTELAALPIISALPKKKNIATKATVTNSN